jgi:hypothetical protein
LQNPGCNDMKSTWGMHRCELPVTRSTLALECLGVEYARDVEMQSTRFKNTQDSVIHYLRNSPDRVSAIVVNTGVHDAFIVSSKLCPDLETRALQPGTSLDELLRPWADLYEGNLRRYLGRMRKQLPGAPILFLTTAVMRAAGGNRTENRRINALIRAMNARAARVAGGLGIELVDVQPLLDSERANELYSDRVHAHAHNSAYYAAVRDLVVLRLGLLAERAGKRGPPPPGFATGRGYRRRSGRKRAPNRRRGGGARRKGAGGAAGRGQARGRSGGARGRTARGADRKQPP